MGHESTVPEEPDKECTHNDEHNKKKKIIDKILLGLTVYNLLEHFLVCTKKKKIVDTKMKIKRLVRSKSAPTFSRYPWENGIVSNNCYAYAVNDFRSFRIHKSIPGDRSGLSKLPHTYTHCKDLARRVMSDNPGKVYRVSANKECNPGFYKIMMFVAPKNVFGSPTGDFHFYKQHDDVKYVVKRGDTAQSLAKFFKIPVSTLKRAGPVIPGRTLRFKCNIWSHKRGWATGALLKDASGNAILDPRKANRKYSHDYRKYCSSFCVKKKGVKVGPGKR